MKITYKNITLRDYQYSDIDDEIRWTNEDVDWFYESSPCSSLERVDPDELRAEMTEFIENFPDYPIRWKFEIDFEGKHIGTLSSYYLDNNFEYTPWESIDQNKNAISKGSLIAVRNLTIERAPTIPSESTTLEVTARITTVVIIVNAIKVVPKLDEYITP